MSATKCPSIGHSLVKRLFVLVYFLIVCCNLVLNVRQIFFVKYFARDAFSTVTGQRLTSSLFTFTSVMFILSMIYSVYFRDEMRLIVDKFEQFDDMYQSNFGRINHVNHRRHVIIYTVFTLAVALSLAPVSNLAISEYVLSLDTSIQFLLFGYVSVLNYAYLQSHVILSVSAVVVRLRAVNQELGTILQKEVYGWRTVSGNVCRVQRCRVLHDILNDIVELINLCFTFHAMWCTLACFGFCLMSLYSDYEILTQKEKSWKFVCVNFAWNGFYMFYSTSIVWVASKMRTEANRTTALVHKIINANAEPTLTDEVHRATG